MHRVSGVLLALLMMGCLGLPPQVYADDPTNDAHDPYLNEDEYQAFYTPPDPLPTRCRQVSPAT